MLKYFYGEDTYAAREAIGDLAKKIPAQLHWIASEGLDEKSLPGYVERGSVGLFGKELMILRNPSQLSKALQEILMKAAGSSRAELVLWEAEDADERSVFFKHFRPHAKHFPTPAAAELKQWLEQEATRRGVSLGKGTAEVLLERLGFDRWRLLSELERLSLAGKEITREWVEAEIEAGSSEGQIFELLRAVTSGQARGAMIQLQNLLESGESELYVVAMLAYQFRTLYLLAQGKTQGISPGAARNLQSVARRRPAVAWLTDLTRVVATDFAIKQGKTDMRTGVTMLVLGLMTPVPTR